MKKSVLTLTSASLIVAGMVAFISACESSSHRENDAPGQQFKSRHSRETMRQDSIDMVLKSVSSDEWKSFRAETDKKFRENEILINDLKMKIKRSGKKSDMTFEKWVYVHEQKNKYLKERVIVYPEIQSDWESFKNEINKDLDDLTQKLTELNVENGS